MSRGGRPLRFLMLVFGAWIGLRTWQLWPDPPVPITIPKVERRGTARRPPGPPTMVTIRATPRRPVSRPGPLAANRPVTTRPILPPSGVPWIIAAVEDAAAARGGESPAYRLEPPATVHFGAGSAPTRAARRWSASGWAMLRRSGVAGGVATPQLGGAQIGVRLARILDAHGRLAIAGRVAAALGTRQQEAAIGIDWRLTGLPVRLVAERRIGLADFRSGTGLGLVGGVSDRPLPGGFRLAGYAQAGAVIRDHADGYADGALHVSRPVWRGEDGTTIALGLGAWGGAQRGAQRLDIGPAATIVLPLGAAPPVRVALEWRERIAGGAQPASGPALSIGTDY